MTRRRPPRLSVIIPCYNGSRFLAPLLARLKPLAETWEVMVVDDGSTDETRAVAESHSEFVTYVWQANRGPAGARNEGVRRASARVIGFLDVDDEWAPAHPAKSLALLHDRGWDAVIGRTQCFTSTSSSGTPQFAAHGDPFHALNVGSALYRREVFDRVGGFNEDLRFGEDVDWFLRAREAGVKWTFFDETTLQYRLHDSNLIGAAGAARGGLLQALHLSMSRRRAAALSKVIPQQAACGPDGAAP